MSQIKRIQEDSQPFASLPSPSLPSSGRADKENASISSIKKNTTLPRAYRLALFNCGMQDINVQKEKQNELYIQAIEVEFQRCAKEHSQLQKEYRQKEKNQQYYDGFQRIASLAGVSVTAVISCYLAAGASPALAALVLGNAALSCTNEAFNYVDGWERIASLMANDTTQKEEYANTLKYFFTTVNFLTTIGSGIFTAASAVKDISKHAALNAIEIVAQIADSYGYIAKKQSDKQLLECEAATLLEQNSQEMYFSHFKQATETLVKDMQSGAELSLMTAQLISTEIENNRRLTQIA